MRAVDRARFYRFDKVDVYNGTKFVCTATPGDIDGLDVYAASTGRLYGTTDRCAVQMRPDQIAAKAVEVLDEYRAMRDAGGDPALYRARMDDFYTACRYARVGGDFDAVSSALKEIRGR